MKTKEPESIENPWASRVDRFPIDRLLREHGYEIAERKNDAMAVWYKRFRDAQGRPTSLERLKDGKPKRYTQLEALASVPKEAREQAANRHRESA